MTAAVVDRPASFKWTVEIRIVHCTPCQVEWNGAVYPDCWMCGQPGEKWALQPMWGSRQIVGLHYKAAELADLDPNREYI